MVFGVPVWNWNRYVVNEERVMTTRRGVKIVTEKAHVGWYAYSENYDGAPDSFGIDSHCAHGKTESDAVLTFLEDVRDFFPDRLEEFAK
jgi:hypothetical protein